VLSRRILPIWWENVLPPSSLCKNVLPQSSLCMNVLPPSSLCKKVYTWVRSVRNFPRNRFKEVNLFVSYSYNTSTPSRREQLRILEVQSEISAPKQTIAMKAFRGCPQFIQANARIVHESIPKPLASTSFPLHYF